ncbi:hypothetical protein SCARD494_11108 [Seiridium cardinale]
MAAASVCSPGTEIVAANYMAADMASSERDPTTFGCVDLLPNSARGTFTYLIQRGQASSVCGFADLEVHTYVRLSFAAIALGYAVPCADGFVTRYIGYLVSETSVRIPLPCVVPELIRSQESEANHRDKSPRRLNFINGTGLSSASFGKLRFLVSWAAQHQRFMASSAIDALRSGTFSSSAWLRELGRPVSLQEPAS